MEPTQINEQEKYREAKKQVQELKGFYIHLFFYLALTLYFIYLNLTYSPQHIWFYWPMLGWGIGLFFHASKVFNFFPFLDKKWEEKKIQEYMNQTKNNQNE